MESSSEGQARLKCILRALKVNALLKNMEPRQIQPGELLHGLFESHNVANILMRSHKGWDNQEKRSRYMLQTLKNDKPVVTTQATQNGTNTNRKLHQSTIVFPSATTIRPLSW